MGLAPAAASVGDPAAPILRRCEAIIEDRNLTVVRDWKKANPGGLAIGHMPVYTPRPLIEAIGCLPVAIFGGGDQVDIIRGDSYYQSYICHIPRSTIEIGLAGDLDPIDGMIFPSICDVIRNLTGMWQMLFPDRYSTYLDLPQNFDTEIGGFFYESELRRIASDLEKRGAQPLTTQNLRQAIVDENYRRKLLFELDELRIEQPWRLSASEAWLVSRAGAQMPAMDHCALLQDLLNAVAIRNVRPLDNVRVVLAGSFCEQPPLGLIRTLERAGCDIVEDDFQLGLRTIVGDIDANDPDPVHALSQAFLEKGIACASRYIDDDVKGQALIDRVAACRADGVLFGAASFCDPALLDQPMLEAALDRAKVPWTSFKFSENTGQFNGIREQAGAFSDSVKLWGGSV